MTDEELRRRYVAAKNYVTTHPHDREARADLDELCVEFDKRFNPKYAAKPSRGRTFR